MNVESQYNKLVSRVLEYIIEIKGKDAEMSLIGIIEEFCFKNNLEPQLVGDAISSNHYLKKFIEDDCKFHNIIRSEKKCIKLDKVRKW
jgi:hypothetical protein